MTDVPGGNSIRSLRTARGWSLEKLAARLRELFPDEDTHFTTVAKIERSQRGLSEKWIRKFAAAFDITPAALMSNESPVVRQVPLIGKIAAGNLREAVQDPTGWVSSTLAGPRAFALYPDGDSMDLVVPPGFWVVFDPDQADLLEGKVYAIMNGDGETTFKRYRADPPRMEPCSSNKAHKPIPLGREPFTVTGRAVEMGSAL